MGLGRAFFLLVPWGPHKREFIKGQVEGGCRGPICQVRVFLLPADLGCPGIMPPFPVVPDCPKRTHLRSPGTKLGPQLHWFVRAGGCAAEDPA